MGKSGIGGVQGTWGTQEMELDQDWTGRQDQSMCSRPLGTYLQ